jgi:hypothetical protein
MARHGTATASIEGGYNELRGMAAGVRAPVTLAMNVDGNEVEDFQPARLTRLGPGVTIRVDLRNPPRAPLRGRHAAGIRIRSCYTGHAELDWLGLALAIGSAAIDTGALNPREALLLADSYIPAVIVPQHPGNCRELISVGCTLALGSGFGLPGSFTCSMFTAVGTLCREAGVPVGDALRMSTIHAALALGFAGTAGSIEAGKDANLLILHVSDYQDIPSYFGVNLVDKMILGGKLIE